APTSSCSWDVDSSHHIYTGLHVLFQYEVDLLMLYGVEKMSIDVDHPIVSTLGNFVVKAFNNTYERDYRKRQCFDGESDYSSMRLSYGTKRQSRERKPSSLEFQGVHDDQLKQAPSKIDKIEDHKEQLKLSGNPTFSLHPELTSPEVNNDIFDSEGCNVLSEKLPDLDSSKDLHPPLHDNPLSGTTTYFSNPLLEEFADELPLEYDDNFQFDIESDLKEIEFLLYQDKDSSLKDSIDQKGLANLADIFVNSTPEMFTDEHALDYSSPPIFDEYDDDLLEVEYDAGNVYDDPFDSKGKKIKESKLLIDELDLPCDFLPPPEYDSFISQDFSRVDALPSTNIEDKIFNPCILIQEKPIKIITRVVQDKNLAIYNASLVLEDFDPPFYEPLFFKEVPKSKMLLPFSSQNEEKVFKPGIHTSKKVHSYFIPKLSHQGYKIFKIN
nr:zinc finger CCCH domain-containing protein 13 [Tanacetum cinerariifolium]